MSAKTVNQDLSGVSETLLIPLYNRATESQRPDAILKDENAMDSFCRGQKGSHRRETGNR